MLEEKVMNKNVYHERIETITYAQMLLIYQIIPMRTLMSNEKKYLGKNRFKYLTFFRIEGNPMLLPCVLIEIWSLGFLKAQENRHVFGKPF